MNKAYIGFGANLGDPIQNIIDARSLILAVQAISNLQCSSLYLSSPVGDHHQPDFINCVCSIDTTLTAQDLLLKLQVIENSLGRSRDPLNQNAARLIDLDLLLFGDESFQSDHLTVPHPRMTQRLFVLEPLLELAPDLYVSEFGQISDILRQGHADGLFEGQLIHRLS